MILRGITSSFVKVSEATPLTKIKKKQEVVLHVLEGRNLSSTEDYILP